MTAITNIYLNKRNAMLHISLPAAITMTGWSERTFFRKFSDGSLSRETMNGKVMIPFRQLEPHLCIPMEPDDLSVLERADAGDAEAQNDLALIFMSKDKYEPAIYWLELAAKQNNADAMTFLSQCYMDGNGVPKDENVCVMWLARAAAYGHQIAQRQMSKITRRRN